jgi:hypothetical protein
MRRVFRVCSFLVALAPAVVQAQPQVPRFALGIGAGLVVPSEDDAGTRIAVGPLFRFGEDEQGWGPAIGLGWFSSVLDGPLGAANGEYARVTVRPIMAGVGYTWRMRQWSYEAAVTVGYSFNSVEALDASRLAFAGGGNVQVDISNSIALRPRVRAWYDINDRVSWMVGTGITFTNPELTFRSGSATLVKELGGASWQIDSGIAFRIF